MATPTRCHRVVGERRTRVARCPGAGEHPLEIAGSVVHLCALHLAEELRWQEATKNSPPSRQRYGPTYFEEVELVPRVALPEDVEIVPVLPGQLGLEV